MTYTACSTMDEYTDLLMVYAGEPHASLLAEILAHKTNCPLCQENIQALETRERERLHETN